MTDAMKWFTANYILPHAEKQPMDFGEQMSLSSLQNELPPSMHPRLETVKEFYALQGFRLGLKLGAALGEELEPRRQGSQADASTATM